MQSQSASPALQMWPGASETPVTAVVLVLPGGRSRSHGAGHRFRLAYRRMLPFARTLRGRGGPRGVEVAVLRYRYRGWNEPDLDPVADARWALAELHERRPGAPVVLLGHSMGGRVAFRVADDPAVVAVCALAPWTEPGEPVLALSGSTVLIAHGDREHMTDPRLSLEFARRATHCAAGVARFAVHGDGHAMLRRAADWTALVVGFVLGVLDVEPMPDYLANALHDTSADSLVAPLPALGDRVHGELR
ncbi:MAG: alpha/beta fold hydrolase [Sciscionella sp.]